MATETAVVATCLIAVFGGVWLIWSVRKRGWLGTWRMVRGLPRSAFQQLLRAGRVSYHALDTTGTNPAAARGGRRRALTTASIDQIEFSTLHEPTHKFRLLYPTGWSVARSELQTSSLVVQITCDSGEESYKRLSVAWDDVSWSAISAADFARGVLDGLPVLVPGSELVSHGLYDPARRADGAYELVYRLTDAVDHSQLQLTNVVLISTHGGRRRAYTITFACDVAAAGDLQRLTRHLVSSFAIDDAAFPGGAAGGSGSASSLGLDAEDHVLVQSHVNVWDRERAKAMPPSLAAHPAGVAAATAAASAAAGFAGDTPTDASVVQWAASSVVGTGLSYRHPSQWLCSGLGHDESMGFAPVAIHSVRRWCIAHTCDRREAAFKHVSVVCADVTPLFDVVAARLAKNPRALEGAESSGALLLAYLAYRYRAELAEAAAVLSARVPTPPPLAGAAEECLRPWLELFGQRWPVPVRLTNPVSAQHANAAAAHHSVAPQHVQITDQRAVGTSRLLKVAGWLRTGSSGLGGLGASQAGAVAAVPAGGGGSSGSLGGGGSGGSGASPRHHSSTYSSLSLDLDSGPAEGLLITTTSAVLLGLHDAMLPTGAPARAAARPGVAPAPLPVSKRVFGHVVTVATSADVFTRYESLAKAVFQSLEAKAEAGAAAAPT